MPSLVELVYTEHSKCSARKGMRVRIPRLGPYIYPMKVFFIGREFYTNSNTMMSPCYQDCGNGNYVRSGWGDIEMALERGETVTIKPANKTQKAWANQELINYLK